jgi:hypothetical protein
VGRQAKDLVEKGFDVKGTRLMLSCLGPTAVPQSQARLPSLLHMRRRRIWLQ